MCGVDSEGNPVNIGVVTDTLIITGLIFDPAVVSSTVDVDELDTTIKLYPNPVGEELFVTFSAPMAGTLSIVNIQGQKLYQQRLSQESQLRVDVNDLSAGVYIVQFLSLIHI